MDFQKVFEKHAVTINGQKVLDKESFAKAIIPDSTMVFDSSSSEPLFKLASQNKDVVTLQDFLELERLLMMPDGDHQLLFKLAQSNKAMGEKLGVNEKTQYKDFCKHLYLLKGQAIKDLFKQKDTQQTGQISGDAFQAILKTISNHRIHPQVMEKIPTLFPKISLAEAVSFNALLSNLDSIKPILESSAKNGVVSQSDFLNAALQQLNYTSFSPIQADLLFRLVGSNSTPLSSFDTLLNASFDNTPKEPVRLSALMETAKSAYNFALGSVAGAIGATFVYPIDLVKTRMQNQRSKVVGQVLYKNGWDCFKKVIKNEGAIGLYSGLLPQLVGVAPEKAIKLTMNDLVRSRLKNPKTGELPLWAEILAGCTAGGSQVLFTNPLEIVKIRLQVQGELARLEGTPKVPAMTIVRQLGLFGLYKGVGACLLRDIPFSGIYFPIYAHLKKDYFQEGVNGKKLSIVEMLTAGALAGMPAAYLVTPADVIKTRLQVQARKGDTTYNGIRDAFVKILKEEGPTAFFKGGLARVMRSSPQFGVTLASYEMLHRTFPVDFGDHPHDKGTTPLKPHEAGARNTMSLMADLNLK